MRVKERLERCGQVVCRISGEEPLRFVNLCRSQNICLYGLQKKEEGYLCAMSLRDFFQIRRIRRLAGVHIQVIRRKGLPFLLKKMEKRSVFFLGIAVCMALLGICYGFIWDIRIDGNQEITNETILRYLKSRQIKCGMVKKNADPHSIAADLRNAFPSFSWVSVEKTGTILKIRVEEARKNVPILENTQEGSLYADTEGEIASVITRSGICMVQEGEYIYPGDLLVSGEIPVLDDGGNVTHYAYCAADADIVVNTAYVYYDRLDYAFQKREYEKPRLSAVQLGWGEQQIKIGEKETKGEYRIRVWQFRLSEAFVLPVMLTVYEAVPFTVYPAAYTRQEAIELLQEHFSEYYKQLRKKVMRITENDVKIILYKDHAVAYGIVYTQERTGALAQIEKSVIETERNDS